MNANIVKLANVVCAEMDFKISDKQAQALLLLANLAKLSSIIGNAASLNHDACEAAGEAVLRLAEDLMAITLSGVDDTIGRSSVSTAIHYFEKALNHEM
jgi:hypothetical protein